MLLKLPVEFIKLKPALNATEVKLIKNENYSYDMIVDRRKKLRAMRELKAENMRKAVNREHELQPTRSVRQVGPEELAIIEKKFVERDQGEEVTVTYLSEMHRIFNADLQKYGAANEWVKKREAWQRKMAWSRGSRKMSKLELDTAGAEIITKIGKDEKSAIEEFEQQNRSQKSADRSLQLMRLRYKIAKSLRITEADFQVYKDSPNKIITELDNMIADPVQVKSMAALVSAFKNVIDMEREEDGWVKGRMGGGLMQLEGEEEMEEVEQLGVYSDMPHMEQLKQKAEKPTEEDVFSD